MSSTTERCDPKESRTVLKASGGPRGPSLSQPYEGTLQAKALALVAAKTRASLMVVGELPEEGLAALDGDGGDVYLALARRLAESGEGANGHPRLLEALFAEARRSEDEADELLVDGGWEEVSEAPGNPIPVLCLGRGSGLV